MKVKRTCAELSTGAHVQDADSKATLCEVGKHNSLLLECTVVGMCAHVCLIGSCVCVCTLMCARVCTCASGSTILEYTCNIV